MNLSCCIKRCFQLYLTQFISLEKNQYTIHNMTSWINYAKQRIVEAKFYSAVVYLLKLMSDEWRLLAGMTTNTMSTLNHMMNQKKKKVSKICHKYRTNHFDNSFCYSPVNSQYRQVVKCWKKSEMKRWEWLLVPLRYTHVYSILCPVDKTRYFLIVLRWHQ